MYHKGDIDLKLQHNISALNTLRNLRFNNTQAGKALEKLSSGYRINRAGDDAAGLAISEKMRSQIRGLEMAKKNASDGISLIQTAEGALQEIHALLQRGRELAVQAANDTNVDFDRKAIQLELNEINKEIDGIRNRTEFNTKKLLQGNGVNVADFEEKQAIVNKLTSYMLEAAEKLVYEGYGLSIDPPKEITVVFQADEAGGWLAKVSSMVNTSTGEAIEWKMIFDSVDVIENKMDTDKLEWVVSHEMVHAMMSASGMDWRNESIPKWFKEGTAEYLTGGHTRLKNDLIIQANSFDTDTYQSESNIEQLLSIVETTDTDIISSSKFYSASYVATRKLDEYLQNRGSNIKELMIELTNRVTLDEAIQNVTNDGSTLSQFMSDLKSNNTYSDVSQWDLSNGEGSVLGPSVTRESLIDDTAPNQSLNEETNFKYIWDTSTGVGVSGVFLQIGANEGQGIKVNLPNISTAELGIENADITSQASAASAISSYDQAIRIVSQNRAYLGAIQNRLEHTIENLAITAENLTASESRIRDTDIAKEMMNLTKQNILLQAAQSMLAQVNQQSQGILQLLG